jgi:hypothetical protein
MGCDAAAEGHWTVGVGTLDLAKTVVTVCRNGTCASATPVLTNWCLDRPFACDVEWQLRFPFPAVGGTTTIDGTLTPLAPGTRDFDAGLNTVEAHDLKIHMGRMDPHTMFDGDVYAVRVEWSDNHAPAPLDVTRTVKYRTYYPNGEECDSEEGYFCKDTSLQ